ncbi:lysylphosphatidylglycerol synthase domain-containing protein [Halogeometricum limi]|uniref:Lysylphosphatidylglycerol synthase TM region n=1 Tax=Halogeometricum limi TaxID=555875 RepID=A0A1I6IA51_9EURY|nr:lysylphosphatidylglycerol synthase domain-containing protein [Halogeometricum limi]SFR63573.1 conserved hypothetical protein [Halogeometricum limi]
MRRLTRFLVGVVLGASAFAGYLAFVGVDDVLRRVGEIAPAAVAVVVLLVAAEGAVDGVGVWASVRPLKGGVSVAKSVQFALAGDFFDTLSPAGPVSSEPIMARFIGVETETTYSDALAVRGVAKYVKSGAQLLVSTALAAVVVAGGSSSRVVLVTLAGAAAALLCFGVALVWFRSQVSRGAVLALTPVVRWLSSLYRDDPYDERVVEAAVERFWSRILRFRDRPGLLALVAVGGVAEQLLVAAALWVALAGTGTTVSLLPIVAIVPLPQASSIVPIPGSLGTYDVLLGGALAVVTDASPASTAAAVVVVRTITLPFGLSVGGLCVAFLRGWRPTAGA